MLSITIDQKKCKRDGFCVKACPESIIAQASPDDLPHFMTDNAAYCMMCGHCVAVCPTGALSTDWLRPEDCLPLDPQKSLTPQSAEQLLRSRRSIRVFQDRPVERDKLETLIEMAGYAPSAKNQQPWHWIVIEDRAEMRQLTSLVIDWMRSLIQDHPDKIDLPRYSKVVTAWEAGQDRICRSAPHIIVAHGARDRVFGPEDCALALDYVELFAPSQGLGTCWGGYFYKAVNMYKPLFEVLAIPAEHQAFGAMMVGYPHIHYLRMPRRNPPRITWR